MTDDEIVEQTADVCEQVMGQLCQLPNGAAQIAAVRTLAMVIGRGLIEDAQDVALKLAVAQEIKEQFLALANEMDQILQVELGGQLVTPQHPGVKH